MMGLDVSTLWRHIHIYDNRGHHLMIEFRSDMQTLDFENCSKLLKAMDDWNQKTHKASGLLEKVKESALTVADAERLTLNFVKAYCLPKKSPLCGNAIHHYRRFLIKYMPKLNDYLHYRHVDVSTLKALIDRWYPKNKDLPKKKDNHRALDDIRESIEELRFYRQTYFKSPVSQSVLVANH